MKKKITLISILLVFSIFVTGCWDYIEYENIEQVIGYAVDFNNETKESTSTLQYLISKTTQGFNSPGSSSGKTGIVYSVTDKTLYETLSKLQQVSMKKLFYGYLRVIILGEEAATYNMMDIMELFDRTPELRDISYFVVCSGKAEKVLSTVDENTTMTSSEIINDLLINAKETGAAFPTTLHDVSEMLAIGGWEITIPRVISTAEDASETEAGGREDNIRLDEKYKGGLRVSGMAAFKGDKFVGWLNEKETRGLGWITGRKMVAYKVSQKSAGTDPADILYFRINKSGGKMKAKLVNNEPVIFVDVSVETDLRKYYSGKGSEYLTPEELTMAENELAESIRSDIQAALIRGQTDLKSDIFGFGFAFFREYPELWQTDYEKLWPDIYPNIPVNVTVKAKVTNTGTNIKKLIIK